ncbi:hypothetical protein ARMGADRAFT_1054899 [Armillaria gallica]|uniref:Uncharacterized protein n=1 Tax=Armillaria gallica TaxID=47427 RepID=A0A2H3DCP6_ARMGA|nr:hypothetical protein ARMGADRAFT_1054899 [Armillaria gallica]
MTQAIAYKGIVERRKVEVRHKTEINLDRIRVTVAEINGNEPDDASIWRAMRHKDMTRQARGFMWKSIHGAFKLGDFWDKLGPEYAGRVICPKCGAQETMEHILLECQIMGQELIWKLTEELWTKKHNNSLVVTKDDKGKRRTSATRLYRIIVSEARRIARGDDTPEKWHTEDEIRNVWLKTVNQRLMLDRLAANPRKYGTKATKKTIVLKTRSGVLENEVLLPEDWIHQRGVLATVLVKDFTKHPGVHSPVKRTCGVDVVDC